MALYICTKRMKVLLLGASGRLGKEILKKLIGEGISTSILVRDRSKIALQSEHLSIFEGTPQNPADLAHALSGCHRVVTTLNISRNSDFPWSKLRAPKTLLSDTITHLLSLAPQHSLQKIVTVSAWGVHETKKDLPFWFRWLIDNSNIKYGYIDHERQEDILVKSDLDWTILRPVGLSNSQKDKPVRVSFEGKPAGMLVSRKSVAAFIVDHLGRSDYSRKLVTLSQ